MSLPLGARLGPYEILSALGAGGRLGANALRPFGFTRNIPAA